jgi:hypothetical protein
VTRPTLPPRRRLVLLGALLATALGGAYMTYGAESVDAAAVDATAGVAKPIAATPATAGNAMTAGSSDAPTAATLAATPAAMPVAVTTASHGARPAAAPDTVVLEREVYGYAGGGRRDPFRPLIVTTVLRPFPSELRLTAVAYDPTGVNSVAILRDLTTKAQHRVRAGQLVGRMRVVRIQPKAVVFAVEELGFSRRETLTLQDSLGSRQP